MEYKYMKMNEIITKIEEKTAEIEVQLRNMDLNLLSTLLEERTLLIEMLSGTDIERDRLLGLLTDIREKDAVTTARLNLMKKDLSKTIEDRRQSEEMNRKYISNL